LAGAEQIGVDLPLVDFSLMAASLGIPGHVIHTAEEFERLDLEAIFTRQGPTVLDIRVDKDEIPPMGLRLKVLRAMQ